MTGSLYTTDDLLRIADGEGSIAIDKMRMALRWAAQVLIAADAAVRSERQRAEKAESELKKEKP